MPARFTGIYRKYTYDCKSSDEVANAVKAWKDAHNTNGGNGND